ncbi:MAG: hypothetical protein ACLQVI_01365 [Polyangiaceae bacterium]|jgi:uncharacterized protein YoxC
MALDAELRRYVDLAGAAARIPLTSEKNLERAARAMTEAAEAERRVLDQVQLLVQAITVARETQEGATKTLNEHVATLGQRQGELEGLLARMSRLGELAKTLNAGMQKIASYKKNPYAAGEAEHTAEADEMKGALDAMEAGMATAATHAEELASHANQLRFEDVARQAEGLRQQVLSAKNRLSLLQGRN